MMRDLFEKFPNVRETFIEADGIMKGLIGENLTDIIFSGPGEPTAGITRRQERLKQTEITQPAVLTADIAILRLLNESGVRPDVVCGHSLGEYAALVAAEALSFKDALSAVSARAKAMTQVSVADSGKMASLAAPAERIAPLLKEIDGYLAIANKNSPGQTVIAGETKAIESALKKFPEAGIQAQGIPVSHAFHCKIVAPSWPLFRKTLEKFSFKPPCIPVLSNVTADYYPKEAGGIIDLLVRQITEPVEFMRQIEKMYADGVRIFLEAGPKMVLTAFVSEILADKNDAVILYSNHHKRDGVSVFNKLMVDLDSNGVRSS
ncbi:MAG: ACP S-malonyltransferase [Elusimicrobia bacterium]|nr:ACP S-malonyltransferase [Elusimicrobiota bacterium]